MWDCQQLIGLTVAATDGEVGRLTDLCFDDERWMIRYFIVNTTANEHQMVALGAEHEGTEAMMASVSVQDESKRPFGALDGGTAAPNGPAWSPTGMTCEPIEPWRHVTRFASTAPVTHLRRVEEVRGYRVVGTDGDIGRVEGFLIADSSWSIQYIIVDTVVGGLRRKLVLLPSWIRSIDRSRCTVTLSVSRGAVLSGPEFTEDINEGYEAWLLSSLARVASTSTH
jgi:hypothetical protein